MPRATARSGGGVPPFLVCSGGAQPLVEAFLRAGEHTRGATSCSKQSVTGSHCLGPHLHFPDFVLSRDRISSSEVTLWGGCGPT